MFRDMHNQHKLHNTTITFDTKQSTFNTKISTRWKNKGNCTQPQGSLRKNRFPAIFAIQNGGWLRIVTWLASLDRKLWGDVYLTVKPHARLPLFFQRKYNYVHDIIKYILHCMTNALVYAWIIIIITIWCTTISERSKRYRIIKWIYIYI
jgi:hypothetical protein